MNCVHDLGRFRAMQRHREPLGERGGRAWRDGGAWWTCSTRTMVLSVRRCQPSRSVAPMRLSSWEVHTTCVHDLGRLRAMQRHREPLGERGGRAWRDGGAWWTCSTRTMVLSVRRCQPSTDEWPSQVALIVGGAHDLRAWPWAFASDAAASRAARRAWWTCLARWWSVVDVQHTHDGAFGPQVAAKHR